MNKKTKLLFLALTGGFLWPLISKAQIFVPQIEGLGELSLEEMIGNIIQIALGFLGLIALIIILYGGFIWMTSGGNEEKITKAKNILKAGVIGLVIILASYIIASFVLGIIQDATDPSGGEGGEDCIAGECTGCNFICGSDGNSFYDESVCNSSLWCGGDDDDPFNFLSTWHSPTGDSVSTCSMIQVAFNNDLNEVTVNDENFKFYLCLDEICLDKKDKTAEGEIIVEGNILQFIMNENYQINSLYLVDIKQKGVTDVDGNSLAQALDWTFRTAGTDDDTPAT
ncbi:Ig-like domain-containing protein, partial [bacterium]|nr:Ig-like domain-containing protein [bacterium]